MPVRMPESDFGCLVVRCADDRARSRRAVELPCDTEVSQFKEAVTVAENVGRFDIPVDNMGVLAAFKS